MKKLSWMIIGTSVVFVLTNAFGSIASTDIGGEFEAEIFEPFGNSDPIMLANSYNQATQGGINDAGLVSDEFISLYSTAIQNKSSQPDKQQGPTPEPASLMIFGIGMMGLAGLAKKKLHNDQL